MKNHSRVLCCLLVLLAAYANAVTARQSPDARAMLADIEQAKKRK